MWPLKDRVAVIYTSYIYTLPPAESIKRETRVQGNKYVCSAAVGPVCIYKNNSPAQCFSCCFSFLFCAVVQPIKFLCRRLLKESRGRPISRGPSLEVYIYFLMKRKTSSSPLHPLLVFSALSAGQSIVKSARHAAPTCLSREYCDFILTHAPITSSP